MIVVDISDHAERSIAALVFQDSMGLGRPVAEYEIDEVDERLVGQRDYYERRENGERHGAEHLVRDVVAESARRLHDRVARLARDAVALAVLVDVLDEIDPQVDDTRGAD